MDEEIQKHCAVKVQAAARAFIARQKSFKTIQERFEKIYDPRREEYYYYDTKLDVASWDKPLLLRDKDILSVAQTYTDDEAALIKSLACLRLPSNPCASSAIIFIFYIFKSSLKD